MNEIDLRTPKEIMQQELKDEACSLFKSIPTTSPGYTASRAISYIAIKLNARPWFVRQALISKGLVEKSNRGRKPKAI